MAFGFVFWGIVIFGSLFIGVPSQAEEVAQATLSVAEEEGSALVAGPAQEENVEAVSSATAEQQAETAYYELQTPKRPLQIEGACDDWAREAVQAFRGENRSISKLMYTPEEVREMNGEIYSTITALSVTVNQLPEKQWSRTGFREDELGSVTIKEPNLNVKMHHVGANARTEEAFAKLLNGIARLPPHQAKELRTIVLCEEAFNESHQGDLFRSVMLNPIFILRPSRVLEMDADELGDQLSEMATCYRLGNKQRHV